MVDSFTVGDEVYVVGPRVGPEDFGIVFPQWDDGLVTLELVDEENRKP